MAYADLVSPGATNFSALTNEQKTTWGRDLWKLARNHSFINEFTGAGSNSLIQTINSLTKSEKGTRAVITLLADLDGDGIVGDNQLEGNEESINSYEMVVQIDQLRNANRVAGRMADQKSIVNFREASRDVLAYWLADRIDQLAFLSLSGVAYSQNTDGTARTGSTLINLDFAADVTQPTRAYSWSSAGALAAGTFATVAAAATPLTAGTGKASYEMIVELRAAARDTNLRGVKGSAGNELYHMFLTPQAMAELKLDPNFLANVRNAGARGGTNPLFAGSASYLVDGVMVHEYRHVYSKAGKARALFCGAQAMAMADIGTPEWVEDTYDYQNQSGISVSKIFGMKKAVFEKKTGAATVATLVDHGVITVDLSE
jgi:N4-gp56 family major capsid protein